jgi:hypothetical protein
LPYRIKETDWNFREAGTAGNCRAKFWTGGSYTEKELPKSACGPPPHTFVEYQTEERMMGVRGQ